MRLRRHPLFAVANSFVGRFFNQLLRGKVIMRVERETFFDEQMRISVPPYQEIFMTGAYAAHDPEVRLTKFFIRNLMAGDIFFDLGAHYGYYSLLAHRCIRPTGKVFAFEPSPLVLPYLKENAVGKSNFEVVAKAVNDRDGSAEFYESDMQFSVISTLNPTNLQNIPHEGEIKRKIMVEAVALDTFCAVNKITPDFIKIDVEGSEEQALRGATQLLRRSSPVVALEIVLDTVSPNYKNAVAILRDIGFVMFEIVADGTIQPLPYGALERHIGKLKARYRRKNDRSIIDNLVFLKPERNIPQRPRLISCPVCSENQEGGFEFVEDSQSNGQTFSLYECPACKIQFWMPFENPGPEWYRYNAENRARKRIVVHGLMNPRSYWNTGHFLRHIKQFAGEILDAGAEGLRVLDIGCGTGELLYELEKMGCEVTGVDFDPEEIALGKKRFGLKRLFAADLFDFLEHCGDGFHVITCFEVLEHVDQPLRLLKLIHSRLAKNGTLVLSTPNRERHWSKITEVTDFPPHHLARYSDQSLRTILARAGFDRMQIKKELPLEFFASRLRFGLLSYFLSRRRQSNYGYGDDDQMNLSLVRPPAYLVGLVALKNNLVKILFFLPSILLFHIFNFQGTTMLVISKK